MNIHAISNVMQGLASSPMSTTGSASSPASGTTLDSNSAEQTFIKLLVTELQSQDPTQPMDPTQMVGQMFSMNQLQQLIDINQTLSTALGTAPSGSPTGNTSSADSPSSSVPSNMAASLAHAATLLPINAAASYAQQILTGAH